MKQLYYLIIILFVASLGTNAQNAMRREGKIKVIVNGDTLRNPWAGGFHAPQFCEVDIDNDGLKDLAVLNRGILASGATSHGFKILTFKNVGSNGQIAYNHMPEWEALFPPLMFWIKMDDLNCDGVTDLIASNQSQYPSLIWFEGKRTANDLIYFEYRDTLITSDVFAPVGLSRIHYPGVSDLDRDGDLEFVNFGDFGTFVMYNNTAIETSGSCQDTVGHEIAANCWGDFNVTASGVNLNAVCPFKTGPEPNDNGAGSGRHNGGALLLIDLDGDNDDDAIYSDIDKSNLFALYNGGDSSYAVIDAVDNNFPSYDIPARITYYPLAFAIDANNDGKKDILAAPSDALNSSSKNATWLYENISTNDSIKLQLKQTDFLEDGMIELGTGAFPVFVDVNGDSLIDLVVGNNGYFRDSLILTAQLALFINVGTPEVPVFELVDDDWLNFSAYYPAETIMTLRPTFGDIDGDGDLDLFLGDTSGYVMFFEDTSSAGNPMAFAAPQRRYFDMYAGKYSAPFIYDVNGDGLLDFLIGNRSGRVRYFENRGTLATPQFDPVPTNSLFGAVNASTALSLFGYSAPIITTLDSTGQLYLLTGNEEGRIYGYEFNPDSIYTGSFNQVFDNYSDIDAGERTAITIADVTNDGKPEMIVGNYRGGLSFYTLSDTIEDILPPVSVGADIARAVGLTLAPNPTTGDVLFTVSGLLPNQPATYSVTSVLGAVVFTGNIQAPSENWSTVIRFDQFPAGLYIVNLSQGSMSKSIKLIKY